MARWIGAVCGAVVLSACARVTPAPAVTLAVPDRASANLSLAAAGDVIALAWGAATEGGATDIYSAVSRDSGRTFAAPVRVSRAAGAQISGEQPPRITLALHPGAEASILVVWTARDTGGTRLLVARSDDGGRSFGRETTVQGSEAAGNRGWESAAADRDGHVATIWLDHRELAEASSAMPMHHEGHDHSAHGAAPDGAARAELSKLYFGFADSSEAPRVLTGGVCYCCKTALAAGADGSLYAAWRHVYPGNIRDIAFTLSRDGGRTFSTPVRVSEDKWVLDGCPENGPAMAVQPKGRVSLVWPTLVSGSSADSEPALALFYAWSDDGRTFSARQRLATEGTPGHAQIAFNAADDSLLIVWDELKDGKRQAVAARGVPDAAGQMQFVREQLAPGGSAYPVAASTGSGFVVAWTDTSRSPSAIVLQRR